MKKNSLKKRRHRFRKIKRLIFLICFLLLAYKVTLLGVNTIESIAAKNDSTEQSTTTKTATTKTSSSQSKEQKAYISSLKEQVTELVADSGDSVSVAYYDLDSDSGFSINGDETFTAASTIKVALAMMVADKIASGELSADESVAYESEDYETGTGIIQSDIQSSYTISTLLKYAIVYSDNIATNMLFRTLGGNETVRTYFYETYLNQTTYDLSENTITANDAITYLELLYENKDNNSYYDQIISYMRNTVFNVRLVTSLTKGNVAHKIGSIDSEVHDIGILYTDHPFLLAVYTNGVSDAESLISDITDLIYEKQSDSYMAS